MYGGDDCSTARCKLAQAGQQVHGCGGIKPRGRLIKEQQRWVDQQLMTHRHTLALPSRNSLVSKATWHSHRNSNLRQLQDGERAQSKCLRTHDFMSS